MNLYFFNVTETSQAAAFGLGTYIRELMAALRYCHINVCVVNLNSSKPQIMTEEIDGIRYWYFPTPISEMQNLYSAEKTELYYRNIVYLLQLHIIDKKNLIFHFNSSRSRKLAEELKKVFDCKIVTSIHYFDWCFRLSGNLSHFKKILASKDNRPFDIFAQSINEMYQRERIFFETVDHIICLSENAQQSLHNDYHISNTKTTVVYNGLTGNNPTSDKKMLRQKYHFSDAPIILFVGRLGDIKGLKYALQAFKIVLDTLPHCHFIIAGNGEFDEYMNVCEDIWSRIIWTGLIRKDKLYDLYTLADIGVMPSFHEQCSYVAIEMMMHGLPVIGSTTTGLKEMIEDGVTGLHIPVIEYDDRAEIDTDLLAEKMLHLLQHPDEQQRMGANARKRYETVYSTSIFRQNMLNFYQSLFPVDL